MKSLAQPLLTLCLTAAAAHAFAQTPFTDPNPGETDRQTIKRILVDNPSGTFVDPNPGEGISPTLKRILLKPVPAAGTTAGTFAAGNDARITGADRGELAAHLYATGGSGTEGNPFTSTDGTGGIGAALAALGAHGGCVTLAARRFDMTTAPTVTMMGTAVRGIVPGANVDPNGESEGVTGSKIHAAGAGIIVDLASGATDRLSGLSFSGFYVWGAGKAGFNGPAGISFRASCDQPHCTDLNFGNLSAGIEVKFGSSASLDTPYFTRINVLHCSFGLVFIGGSAVFAHVTDCCFSDLDNAGIYDGNSGGYGVYAGVTLARCAGYGDHAVILRTPGNRLVNSVITRTGARSLTAGHNVGADGVVLSAAGNTVSGCVIELTAYGSGVHVNTNAAGCVIRGNRYSGNATDITIDAGCTDTVVDEPGQVLNIVDNGTRTVISGQAKNAGDPNAAGDWNGHAKPAGLQIIDTTTGDVWLYNAALSGGRKKL